MKKIIGVLGAIATLSYGQIVNFEKRGDFVDEAEYVHDFPDTDVENIFALDFDNDGDDDVFLAADGIKVYENDGLGSFEEIEHSFYKEYSFGSWIDYSEVFFSGTYLDDDSLPELAILSESNRLDIYEFDNIQGFVKKNSIPGFQKGKYVEFADMDGVNGKDIVTFIDNQLKVLYNNGSGQFTTESITTLPIGADLISGGVVLDINGDSYNDVVTIYNNSIWFFINNQNKTYTSQISSVGTSGLPHNIEKGYFNNDTVPDFAINNNIYINNENSTFDKITLSTSLSSFSFLVLDIDNDGDSDLLLSGSDGVDSYINNGNAQFHIKGQPEILSGGNGNMGAAYNGVIKNMFYFNANNDELLDVLFFHNVQYDANKKNRFNYAINQNDTILKRIEYSTLRNIRVTDLIGGDINNDGLLDFMQVGLDRTGMERNFLYLNQGGFKLELINSDFLNGYDANTFEFIHLNSDEYVDIMITQIENDNSTSFIFFVNNQNNSFSLSPTTFNFEGGVIFKTDDLNNNGFQDLCVLKSLSGITQHYIYFNNKNGGFELQNNSFNVNFMFPKKNLYFVDYNNDGALDIVGGKTAQLASETYMNSGSGTFFEKIENSVLDNYLFKKLIAKDLNRDGLMDFVFMPDASDDVKILMNEGNNNFIETWVNNDFNARDFELGDLNGDSLSDLILFDKSNYQTRVYMNQSGAFNEVQNHAFKNKNGVKGALFRVDEDFDLDFILYSWELNAHPEVAIYSNLEDHGYTSINEKNINSNISLFPNPTSGKLFIMSSSDINISLEEISIYSSKGELVNTVDKASAQTNGVTIKGDRGLYFVKIKYNGTEKNFKVFKY